MEAEGFLEEVLEKLIELAEMVGGVDPERVSIDGFFSTGRGGGEKVEYGCTFLPCGSYLPTFP